MTIAVGILIFLVGWITGVASFVWWINTQMKTIEGLDDGPDSDK